MKIRLGTTPHLTAAPSRVRSAFPSVSQGRVVKPIPPPTPHYPPVHFFAEAAVESGAEATLRSEALSNRTGRPIEIREIRVAAWIDPQTAIEQIDTGGMVRLRLSMNDKPITRSFVPFWLLGKTEQEPSQVFTGTAGFQAAGSVSIYIWRLSRPWYVPPNALVSAEFQHTGAIREIAHAMIGLAGHYTDRRTTSFVPYAAAFVSKPFEYGDIGFDESSENDLVNDTKKSLHVDRIIARIGVMKNESVSANLIGSYLDRSDAGPTRMVNLRILTSTNLPIIRDYSSPRAIFGYSRSLDAEHVMAPGDFYRVGVQKIAGPIVVPAFTTWSAQANVSILGCREEAV